MLQIVFNVLKRIPIFQNLDFEKHRSAVEKIQLMYFPAEHVIFREGDPAKYLYILKSGHVEVFREGNNPHGERIAVLKPGDFFGEMGLIENAQRNASVRTLTEVEAFFLDDDTFRQLASDIPELDATIVDEYLKRKSKNSI